MDQVTGKSGRKIPGWLMPALAYALSAASLIWVFHDFDFQHTLTAVRTLNWRYVAFAVIVDLSVYLCHGWRWNILLRPVARLSFWRTVQAIYIGLYANEILPLRTGEVIRCYLLAHWNKVRISIALSSAAIERILDGIWLVIALIITTQTVALPSGLVQATFVLSAFILVLTSILIFIAVRQQTAPDTIPKHWRENVYWQVVAAIRTIGNRRTMLAGAGASFVYLALQVIALWALMEGYGLDLSIGAAAVVYIVNRLGTVIPNAPGNAGVTQVFYVLGLQLFSVPQATAKEFSFIAFVILTLPLLIGGFVAVALTGLKLHDIRLRAQSSVESAVQAASD